ncbi:rRNA maturation RNase YbeY [Luteirhabdus pelagi]|uniref:rRNA maturation RNase YbeY n=1 Tax=Luteirhabdus pelagi TaxID=2792783 RepID=UPI0019399585|nr:rRNA maturation RNase YbeY [Luteirhabdus pelagi]
MIEFYSETDFHLQHEDTFVKWITNTIKEEGFQVGGLTYVFCDDDYLLQLNEKFLNHDTYTDIITFDYSLGKELHGEIYISVDRVKENAETFKVTFDAELRRVMIHGILHLCEHEDASKEEKEQMRALEDRYLKKFLS